MAQSLLIGLGGTGSRVVNNVVRELQRNGKTINDGQICCAVLDTNCSDNSFIEETGTNVPVVGTSKPQRIVDYFSEYPKMREWSPASPAFLQQSMLDGASETRVKSRIAFEDCLESGVARDLEDLINNTLKVGNNSKIRIMLVSSLSGGTGSGMFIHVALWLRKILANSEISIRGLFLLPDVFVSTIKDIRDNKTTQVRHYANAYAAIRELNAITKVMQGSTADLEQEFEIGELFNSATDKDKGTPVFDYAFFVDNKDSRGVHLEEIGDYEKMAAQLAYMQLYSPMVDDMYSEEDNLFQAFIANEEPKYGTCGASKAVYPMDSVKSYSAMRAVQDSLKNGWQRIDDEIAMRIEEKKQEELERGMSSDTIDPRYEYVRLFEEKTSVSEEEAGRDRFFLALAKEAKNETKGRRDSNGKVPVTYSDKVEDFIRLLKIEKIDRTVLKYGRTAECARNPEKFIAEDHDAEAMKTIVKGDEEKINAILDEFDKKVDEYATSVVNTIFPYSMGDVAEKNRCSIHGLMTKPNEMGGWDYIHPIVGRYLCYRLVSRLELALNGIDLETSREDAVTGGDENVLIQYFDNPATPERESSAGQLAESRRWFQGETSFMDKVEKAYMDFMANKIERCDTYQKECLQVHVYRKLIERLELLIQQLEAFFESLPEARRKLQEAVDNNVESTQGTVGKVIYVYAAKENKEQVYNSLDLGQNRSNTEINKSVLNAAYGRVCAQKRPSNEENAPYCSIGAATAFLQEALRTFRKRIEDNPNNLEKLDLDIYTAICRETDAKHGTTAKQTSDLGSIDFESGTVKKNNAVEGRHDSAFVAYKNLLVQNAAPFLLHEKEVSENDMGTKIARSKVFWGYHPALVASCSILGKVLGINTELQANDAYPKNELHCYRAEYGMEARYIPKFNEMNNGEYYRSYKFIVDEMETDAHGKMGERSYVRTPHLDKRFHRILPYVTDEMQSLEAARFFRGFWLGIAYGNVKVGKDGNMCVRRSVDAGYGNMMDEDVPVMFKNKPVGKTEVAKLIAALRTDAVFASKDIPGFEARFAEELEDMDTYIGTKALQGLVKKNEYLQPVDMIVRYCDGTGQKLSVVAAMINGLEAIAADLAANYYRARSGERSDVAKYKICKRIHAAASRKNLKINAFRKWEDKFEELKITDESEE